MQCHKHCVCLERQSKEKERKKKGKGYITTTPTAPCRPARMLIVKWEEEGGGVEAEGSVACRVVQRKKMIKTAVFFSQSVSATE